MNNELTDSNAGSQLRQSRNFGGTTGRMALGGEAKTQSALVLQGVNISQGGTMRMGKDGNMSDPKMLMVHGGQRVQQNGGSNGILDSQDGVNTGDV